MGTDFDQATIEFYDAQAGEYARFLAERDAKRDNSRIENFIARLPQHARVLELGTGGGHDAEIFIRSGIDIDLTDGSTGLAAGAKERLGRTVRIMRFDELDAVEAYDGVWANACLLHVPENSLADIFARIWRSLKPGGIFHCSFKAGDGEARDKFGRLYNFPNEERLRADFARSGSWPDLDIRAGRGNGYDGVNRVWFYCTAVK